MCFFQSFSCNSCTSSLLWDWSLLFYLITLHKMIITFVIKLLIEIEKLETAGIEERNISSKNSNVNIFHFSFPLM